MNDWDTYDWDTNSNGAAGFEARLTESLVSLAQAPAPPAALDLGRARKDGLRALRRRRIGTVVTAAVAAGAVGLGGVALADTTGAGRHQAAQPASLGKKAHGHDPLQKSVQFGWLPAGVGGSTEQDAEYDGLGITVSGGEHAASFDVAVLNRGVVFEPYPRDPLHPPMHSVPGPSVNGRPSTWMVDPGGRMYGKEFILRWRLADGRWVEVLGTPAQGDKSDMRATVLHVAETMRLPEAPQGTPLPYFVTGLPHGAKPMSVMMRTHVASASEPWQLDAWYTLSEDPRDRKATGGDQIEWAIAPHVPGRKLLIGDIYRCVTRNGLDLCVGGSGPTLAAVGGLDGLIRRIGLLGPDPSRWTTNVVR